MNQFKNDRVFFTYYVCDIYEDCTAIECNRCRTIMQYIIDNYDFTYLVYVFKLYETTGNVPVHAIRKFIETHDIMEKLDF